MGDAVAVALAVVSFWVDNDGERVGAVGIGIVELDDEMVGFEMV